ncbi:MAG: hypothetical protein JWL60_974 [Gemmatimonadetes bacterium]|jgi:hypothetical protein|nr:hypothetical protein [Gemmatimonadota bacterium]
MHSLTKLGTVVGSACLLFAGCKPGLDVVNPNEPDIPRALASSQDVRALASSSVNTWYLGSTNVEPWVFTSVTADVGTMNFGNFGARFNNLEPRIAYANSSAGNDRGVAEQPWRQNYRALGAANDALRAIAGGIVITSAAETNKYRRLAQFTQAASFTNLALTFDKAFIVDEKTAPGSPLSLKPYKEVSDEAVKRWAALAADASGKSDTYALEDMRLSNGVLTSAKLVRIANTYAALTMAYTPRTAAEAGTVNWGQVATYAAAGIGSGGGAAFDFTFEGDATTWYSDLTDYHQSPSWIRVDHRVINRMDPNIQPKYNGTKVAPNPAAADKRLFSDYEYLDDVVGDPNRGIYMQSNFRHKRYEYYGFDYGENEYVGPAPYILAAESDLVHAEALIRKSAPDLATAATLINRTRVTRGGLTPATAADGAAALLGYIEYERDVELFSTNAWDLFRRRHVDGLQAGTARHLPLPASELETLALPIYTFGSPGKEMSLLDATSGLVRSTFSAEQGTKSLSLPNGDTMELHFPVNPRAGRSRRQ